MPHPRPVVLVHGYSDKGASFGPYARALRDRGFDIDHLHISSYKTLTNEVTIKDIAEAFDRSLRDADIGPNDDFDAIVHSTGMLVVRAWLTNYQLARSNRRGRLKHLVGLAPATFGSPLAHRGRSWLGALFKGNRVAGPDFLEAGDLVLDALELASRFTWDLAHQDLVGANSPFGRDNNTPYAFIFCGNRDYDGLRDVVAHEDGTDGTVRWAGVSLTTRKVILDLTVPPDDSKPGGASFEPWSHVDAPVVFIHQANHGTILSNPGLSLDWVVSALNVNSADEYARWVDTATTASARVAPEPWQQFVVRAVDERGDPITDYNLQLFGKSKGLISRLKEFELDVHPYSADKSLRCFHIPLKRILEAELTELHLRVMATSGSVLVEYYGANSETVVADQPRADGVWDAKFDMTPLLKNKDVRFFYPFTTTLVELRLNREPLPLKGTNKVCFTMRRSANKDDWEDPTFA